MTLTEFLKARINDDERRLDAPDFTETDSVRGSGWGDRGDCPICGAYAAEGTESVTEEAWYQHAEWVHQRTRVLAECEAKRAIVQMLVDVDASAEFDGPPEPNWVSASEPDGWSATTNTLVHVLCVMAAPFADHPDFHETWRL